ncbi:MAG: phage major capsid protein [Anaerolineae bacterium]
MPIPNNEAAQRILDAAKRTAAEQERRGEKVTDPAKNPNLTRWTDSVAKGKEILEPAGQNAGSTSDYHAVIAGFAESPQFKNWISRGMQGASGEYLIPGGLHGQSMRSRGADFREKTAHIGTVSDIRNVLATAYIPGIIAQGVRMNRIRDMFTVLPTSQGSIHYLREGTFTNNAGTIAENTDPASVSNKGQSTLAVSEQAVTIRTIAHYLEFPRQLMDDVTLLVPYLQARLEVGLDDEEDRQILHGSGTGADFNGIFNDTNVTQYTWGSDGVSGDNRADAFLMACTQIVNANYMPTGIGMGYTDWARIAKLKTSTGEYLIPEVHKMDPLGRLTLWGLPVTLSPAFTLGQGLVGAMGNPACAYIADREQTVIRMTDAHASRFIANILTLLLEKRAALIVCQPAAFRQVALTAAPSGTES